MLSRRATNKVPKCRSHGRDGAEPCLVGYGLQVLAGLLQQSLRQSDPLTPYPLLGPYADLRSEVAQERALAHGGSLGEIADTQCPRKQRARPI